MPISLRRAADRTSSRFGTADQEYEADRTEQCGQSRTDASSSLLADRHEPHASASVRRGKFPFQTGGDPIHFKLCLLESDAPAQPRNDTAEMRIAADSLGVSQDYRGPEIPLSSEFRKMEIRRHYPDNGIGAVVQPDTLANNPKIRAELAFPNMMAEHDHSVRAILLFIRRERAAEFRGRAKQLKEVRGYR